MASDGSSSYLPWIPITVRNLAIPVPKDLKDRYEIIYEMNPGFSYQSEIVKPKDLDKNL